jgi:excisionase family DNA binding protein
MPEEWLTTQEAAELSGYHPEHLRKLIRKGSIKAKKFGPVWAVDWESLQDYLDSAGSKGDSRWGPKPN